MENMFVVVRSGESGVWFGKLVDRRGPEVKLDQARKVWRWRGANTTVEIALHGVDAEYSRVSEPVDGAVILGVCEVLPASPEAVERIGKAAWAK